MRVAHLILPLVLVAACALPPIEGPDDAALRRADYPQLRPLSEIVERAETQAVRIGPEATGDLARRARALRTRAALLRRDALGPADRERLRGALARLRAAR